MASEATIPVAVVSETGDCAALQHRSWRRLNSLSSGLRKLAERLEKFLATASFERAPWLAVAFAAGIGLWFELGLSWQWLVLVGSCLIGAFAALKLISRDGDFPYVRQALAYFLLAVAAGCLIVWAKSALVGTEAIARPFAATITGRVLDRQEQPADQRVRLVLAMREPVSARAIRVRLNVPMEDDRAEAKEGAIVRLRARLMPPAAPMLPGVRWNCCDRFCAWSARDHLYCHCWRVNQARSTLDRGPHSRSDIRLGRWYCRSLCKWRPWRNC
jgi:competence protein ComEC